MIIVGTVAKEDKSMKALINNGNDWMSPLLRFQIKKGKRYVY